VPTPLKMNNQSPLIPQGSLLEQKNKTRIRVKLAVIFVLALHGIGLLALLMQGCGQEKAGTSGSAPGNSASAGTPEPAPANPAPSFAAPTNAAPEATSATATATSPPPSAPTNQAPAPLPPENTNVTAAAPQPGLTDYKILKGDTLFKIHKKLHVGLQALIAANPGVDSAKLKIDQTIHIPAQTAVAAAASGPGATPGAVTEGGSGQQVYTVKSNDNLAKIAGRFGLKVKALRVANNLKTDKIRVGQKLKIPAKTEAAPAPAATGSSSGPATPPGR